MRGPSEALRAGTAAALLGALAQLLANVSWMEDQRDLLTALAPYHDCARRLGLDPVSVFDAIARDRPTYQAELLRRFGRRTDVTGTNFAFVVEDADEGPAYFATG